MSASVTSQVGHRCSLLWLHTKAQCECLTTPLSGALSLIRACRLDNYFHDVSCHFLSHMTVQPQSIGAPVGCQSEQLLTGTETIVLQAMEWHSFLVQLSKDWKRTEAKLFIIIVIMILKVKRLFETVAKRSGIWCSKYILPLKNATFSPNAEFNPCPSNTHGLRGQE